MPESYKEDGRPAQQWYWDDWFSAFDARLCSLAARGLWIDMLGIMWKAEIRGTLTVNGRQADNEMLAKITGDSKGNIDKYIKELENNNVFSRLDDGTIICRRVLRESGKKDEISRIRSDAGLRGALKRWGKELPEDTEKKNSQKSPEMRKLMGLEMASLMRSERMTRAKNKGKHIDKQWQNLKEAFDFTCLRCNKKEPGIELTKDHVIPILLGGSDHISNIQPLCQSCNSAKGREIENYKKSYGKSEWQKITKIAASSSTPTPISTSSSKDIVKLKKQIIDHFNETTSQKRSYTCDGTNKLINGRLDEGKTLNDFKHVIDTKTSQWLKDPKMAKFLRPSTLFRPGNFEDYLNEAYEDPKKKVLKVGQSYEKEPSFVPMKIWTEAYKLLDRKKWKSNSDFYNKVTSVYPQIKPQWEQSDKTPETFIRLVEGV